MYVAGVSAKTVKGYFRNVEEQVITFPLFLLSIAHPPPPPHALSFIPLPNVPVIQREINLGFWETAHLPLP